jgi:hypothetical protein
MGMVVSKNKISKNIAPIGKIMGSDNSSDIMVTAKRRELVICKLFFVLLLDLRMSLTGRNSWGVG